MDSDIPMGRREAVFKPPGGVSSSAEMRNVTKADVFTGTFGAVSLLAGLVVLLAVGETVGSIVGACLLGLAGIAFVALAFLVIGEGEDRDRSNGAL